MLFGVGSDGSCPQWDGGATPRGILLRWLQDQALPFPEHGYELERAPAHEPASVDYLFYVDQMRGRQSFAFHDGAVVFESDVPFAFTSADGRPLLLVPPDGYLSVRFPTGPAWMTIVRGRPTGQLTIEGLVGGEVRITDTLEAGRPVEWRTRGHDEIRVRGEGELHTVQYQLLDAPRAWQHVAHLCLPVVDPRYPCGPTGVGPNEAVAASRVPPGVDWARRYSPSYPQLDAVLVALATKSGTAAATRTTPANPSTTALPPTATTEPARLVHLAALDPHLARAVGLLYDDDLAPYPFDGRPWAYRVTGRWAGPLRPIDLTAKGLAAAGVALTVDGAAWVPPRQAGRVPVERELVIDASAATTPLTSLTVLAKLPGRSTWTLTDTSGKQRSGVWRSRTDTAELAAPTGRAIARVTITGTAAFVLNGLRRPGPAVERSSILPWVLAANAPAPPTPAAFTVDVAQPGGAGTAPRAALRWDTHPAADPFGGGTIGYQVGGHQLSPDPTAAPPPAPPLSPSMLLDDGAPVVVTPAAKAAGGPLAIDRPLPEGWRAWWVRSVDLFGRVSTPAGPEIRAITDNTVPPPPVILAAEYAQPSLDPQMATLLGRSSAGDDWVAGQPATGGTPAAIVTFAWTPELDAACPDVDTFHLYARTPAPGGGWDGRAWGAPIARFSPTPLRFDGTVATVDTTLADLSVITVEPLDPTHSRCTTDLPLDVAGALIGAELRQGRAAYPVVSQGEGHNALLVVSHPAGAGPVFGLATVHAGTSPVRLVTTTIGVTTLRPDSHRRRLAGVLTAGTERFTVVAASAPTFLAAPVGGAGWPAAGAAIRWLPAYRVAVADTGFGPRPTLTDPDAMAQLAVTSVRRSALRPAESPPSTPATVHAVDTTPPPPPTIPTIPAGERCAQLATAADWHGISRFTLTWNAAAGAAGYHVHRAMDQAVGQADRAAHGTGAGSLGHSFPPASLPADPARRAAVTADLAALDTALRTGDDDAIARAYRAMRADAWQLVASQPEVDRAFVLLNGTPVAATVTHLEDRFDGVADAHWFYRVSSRSAGGLTSSLSPSTPPICAPRTTPPRPPRALLALAGEAEVTLRFAPSPSAGIARYRVYRTHDPDRAADVRTMDEHARLTPTPTSPSGAGEERPAASGSALSWVDSSATPGQEWHYRLVAEDGPGNRSQPTAVLSARSLHPVPEPPVWSAPVRDGATVQLRWTHTQQRMASRVERRRPGGMWREITSGWLPRGQYRFDDTPPDAAASWEYRLSVRDHAEQLAPVAPVVTMEAVAP